MIERIVAVAQRRREEGVSLLRQIVGKDILVISGPGRMMYQSLQPKPEVTIFPKRSKPQEDDSSPHDTAASVAEQLEMNIQGRKGCKKQTGNLS